jgi:hypothetical protein
MSVAGHLQQECCGSMGPSDWAESAWRTEAATNGEDAGLVPITCCTQLEGATPRNPIAKSFGRCQQPDAGPEWRHMEVCTRAVVVAAAVLWQ